MAAPAGGDTPVLLATVRILGIVVTTGGRTVDIALIETDGGRLIRRIETERVAFASAAEAGYVGALGDAVLRFMGDRALQPFAVDLIALDGRTSDIPAPVLETLVGVCAVCVGTERGPARFARAERVALAGCDTLMARSAATRA